MTVPKIRASEREAFRRCPAMWWWKYREGLVKRGVVTDARWFGTGVHLALAAWYTGPGTKRGVEPVETWEEYAKGVELAYVRTDDPDEEKVAKYEDARELGVAMLTGYREKYGTDEEWLVVQPEKQFRLQIPWPEQNFWDPKTLDEWIAELVGTYDLALQHADTGRYWLAEHKTAKAIITRHLSLDNQAGTYWATATTELQRLGLIGPKDFLAGIVYNFLRKGMPDERPRDAEGYATNKPTKADYLAALQSAEYLPVDVKPEQLSDKATLPKLVGWAEALSLEVLGERSKIQPPPLFVRHEVHRTRPERRAQLLRVQQDALEMELHRDGLLPVGKTTTRDCSFCDYFDMCELQERGGDWESLRDVAYEARDPYADHRKSTDD